MIGRRLHSQVKASAGSSFTPVRGGMLQRKCACGGPASIVGECAECSKHSLSIRRSIGNWEPPSQNRESEARNSNGVPPIVHEVLNDPGQPLDTQTRDFMEHGFGHDFSQVRVHTDGRAAESAQAVNSLAYTVGQDTVFSTGQYAPQTSAGRKLLAHELVHTIQQPTYSSSIQANLDMASPNDPSEQEADAIAAEIIQGESSPPMEKRSVHVARATTEADTNTSSTPTGEMLGLPETGPCNPAEGLPNTSCGAYWANSWWLPFAYVNNATCACTETPNEPTANCVRKFLQDRLAATPAWLKGMAAGQKLVEASPFTNQAYALWVQTFLTPRIYQDHVDAYERCCCTSGPAPYPAWIGVTTVPLPCSSVGDSIRRFGSCHGTPGKW